MSLPDSRHFTAAEFRCADGSPYPEEWADDWARISGLADAVRDLWGGPLAVISGYRTPHYNEDLIASGHHNVASSSQHIRGLAVDLRPVGALAVNDAVLTLHDMILRAYEAGQLPTLGGLGLYPATAWVHCDARTRTPPDHLARWSTR